MLLAIFLPFLSFFFQGKIISAVLAFILQIVAVFTFLFFGLGFIIWLILAIWAGMSLNNYKATKRHEQLVKEVNKSL